MLISISWTNYICVVLLFIVAYYAFIGIRFYSADLKNAFANKRKPGDQNSQGLLKDNDNSHPAASHERNERRENDVENLSLVDTSEDAFRQVELLIEKLKKAINEAARKKYIKEEFIYSLGQILKNHQGIKGSTFQSAINELINSESEKLGFLTLDDKEMLRMWDEVT